MSTKRLMIGFCGIIICVVLQAQEISSETALLVAENFLEAKYPVQSKAPLQIHPWGNRANPTMYVVSSSDSWVLVAADRRVQPILAYSGENGNGFPSEDDMPPVMMDLLEWYSSQIQMLRDSNISRGNDSRWNTYLDADYEEIRSMNSVVVSPLINRNGMKIRWKQHGNNEDSNNSIQCYNKYCPPATGSGCYNAYTFVGCTPLALAQIMWYWQWPFARKIQENSTTQIHRYQWEIMPCGLFNTTSTELVDAIAILLHDIGISVQTTYGCSASSTNTANISSNVQSDYKYLTSAILYRQSYSNNVWLNIIKSELNNSRPIFYGGYGNLRDISGLTGHAFFIDGYDSDNKFHMYMGGGYADNDYYSLDAIAYSSNQLMMTIQPNNLSCSPITVPSSDVWNDYFIIQNRGGISVGNRTIPSGKHGMILSGNYVRLTSGFKVNQGAQLYIACQETNCINNRSEEPALMPHSQMKSAIQEQETNAEPSAHKILRDGQVLILRGDKTYTATGQEVR